MGLTPPQEPAHDATGPDAPTDPPPPLRPYRDLPSAEQAALWEDCVRGAGERILRLVELDFERQREEHEQWCRDREHQRRLDRFDLWFRAVGAAVGAGGAVGYLLTAKYVVDHGAAASAAGLLGGGVTVLTAVLLRSQYRNSR